MLKQSLDAFVGMSSDEAYQVLAKDDEVDKMSDLFIPILK